MLMPGRAASFVLLTTCLLTLLFGVFTESFAAEETIRRHWSFLAPQAVPRPEVTDNAWPRNEVDHFILAHLEREGLAPSPEADRPTLIRRLTLDLTGLPPTLEEVDAFLAD